MTFDPIGTLLFLLLFAMVAGARLEWRDYREAQIRATKRKEKRNG